VEVASGHLEYEQADADALSAVSTRPLTGQPISLLSTNNIGANSASQCRATIW
jgi:hypothetical protein